MGKSRIPVLQKLKSVVTGSIERFFYWYGHSIALNPWKFIGGCFFLAAVCSLGLLRFHHEKNPMKLWIPPNSDFKSDTDWIVSTFKEGYRMQYFLITAPDVLQPDVIREVERVRKRIDSMSYKNVTWEEICFRIPAIKRGSIGLSDLFGRKKRSFFFLSKHDENSVAGLSFDPSLYLSYSSYCNIVNRLPKICLETNLPQIWSNDDDQLDQLTKDDIIDALNKTTVSPIYGHPTDYESLLGGVERDGNGRIISAKSLLSVWLTHVDFSAVNMDETGNIAGTGDWVTEPTSNWEEGYLKVMGEETEKFQGSNITTYYEAGRSYGDISSKSMFQDIGKLFIGNLLMFSFVQFVLPSRYNLVEMRLWLGCVGLFCILLSFIMAVSICSLLGISYGPVHTSLPFLLLGIGVDDMFVIISCWKNLSPAEKKLKLEDQIALTLGHAGVSITVTSMTDLVAFLVGSFTILPCLQSFCLFTAIGIFCMYLFQATVFVAFLSLDEKRIQACRNTILPCIEHKNFKRKEFSIEETYQSKVFGYIYGKLLFSKPLRFLVLLLTATFAGICIHGNMHLTQKFDPQWFLPNNSYLLQFQNQRSVYYPDLGKDGGVFIGKLNYSQELRNIHNLYLKLNNETGIVKLVDSWTIGFIKYTRLASSVNVLEEEISDSDFSSHLSKFLWSPNGARFQKNFRFEGKLVCGEPAPPIIMSTIDFVFRIFSGPEEHLPAMNHLKRLVREANFTSGDARAAVWSKIFANWVTDEVIDKELYRNLAMALGCVMACTGILIVDLQTCFWIFTCVLLTLVDVSGFMYYWGLYIDIASCIALVLAVGLCVDFAAHVGHIFLTFEKGSREERALSTVKYIGTAAANGAFSTLLAVSVLGNSDAYIFQTFFKIFFLVLIFGLFHGVVFLPVILSLIGPSSYSRGQAVKLPEKEMISSKVVDMVEENEAMNKTDCKEISR